MTSGDAIRKLLESDKLSDSCADQFVPVMEYPRVGDIPDAWNWHHFDRFYEIHSGDWNSLSVEEVCNQIIHSFVFVVITAETGRGFAGVLVSSDRRRKKCLYQLDADPLIGLIRQAGEEELVEIVWERHPATGQRARTKAVAGRVPK